MGLHNTQSITWRCDLCGAEIIEALDVHRALQVGDCNAEYLKPCLPMGWQIIPNPCGFGLGLLACDRHWLTISDAGFDVPGYLEYQLHGLPATAVPRRITSAESEALQAGDLIEYAALSDEAYHRHFP